MTLSLRGTAGACVAACLALASTRAAEKAPASFAALLNPGRVVFLGDSITYDGRYIAWLETYLRLRQPGWHGEFINVGLPSETVSGLSEPGHAGGSFPRPWLHERLARVLEKLKPDVVVACYGMNCGMYYPLNDERLGKYQQGIRDLRQAVTNAGAVILHLTPPVFDPLPLGNRALPAGRAEYRSPYAGYDEVLTRYSDWLLEQRAAGWSVVDIHGPMTAFLKERRRTEPRFLLAGDGVHAGATGHWLMTAGIIDALKLPGLFEGVWLRGPNDDRAQPVMMSGEPVEMRFATVRWTNLPCEVTCNAPVPLLRDRQWDAALVGGGADPGRFLRQSLIVSGLPEGRYDVRSGTNVLGTFPAGQLAAGVDLGRFPALPMNTRAAQLAKQIGDRQRLLSDAWLNEAKHLRPGMAKGLPVPEATNRAARLDATIATLLQPVPVTFRVTPAAAP